MWHILEADPGSVLICGMDPGVTADRLAYPGTRGLDELVTLARAHGEQAAGLGAATDTLVEALWQELRASPLHDS